MLAAAEELTARGLAKIILLGKAEPVQAEARRLGLDISQACSLPDACLWQYWMVQQMTHHSTKIMLQSTEPAACSSS